MNTYTIAIDLLMQSPLHISAIEPGRYLPDLGRIVRGGNDDRGVACTLTRTMELARPAPRVVKRDDGSEFALPTVAVPTIPANTIAGRLRRKAAELIAESLVARELRISARAYNTLSAGTADASLQASAKSIELVGLAKADAYLAVFGGTTFALTKGLRVFEGLPVTEDTVPLLNVAPQTANVFGSDMLTGVVHFTKKDDVFDIRNPELLERAVGVEPVSEYVGAIVAGRSDKKARKQAQAEGERNAGATEKKTELATHACFEVARPGLSFALRFVLKAPTEAALGLTLLSLQRMANESQIGGKAAAGCGYFAVTSARLYPHTGFERAASGIELWTRAPGGEYVFSDDGTVQKAVHAGQDYVDQVDPAIIEAFANGNVETLLGRKGG